MVADRDDRSYVWDMLTAATLAQEFLREETFDTYLASALLRSAVERQIEIIGEAARHVSAELQTAHPEIPWRPIKAQRHVLAHDYGEINHERLWLVVRDRLPELVPQLRRVLDRLA